RDPAEGHGPGSLCATSAGGKLLCTVEFRPETDRRCRGLPSRRRGTELCGQWHDLRAYEFPGCIRTASSARCGNLDWRGALCAASRVEGTAVLSDAPRVLWSRVFGQRDPLRPGERRLQVPQAGGGGFD